MKKLLFIAVFINCGLASFWAMMGNVENTVFSGCCSVLCWIGYVLKDKGKSDE